MPGCKGYFQRKMSVKLLPRWALTALAGQWTVRRRGIHPLHLHLHSQRLSSADLQLLDPHLSPQAPRVYLGVCPQIESSADTLARHHHAPLIKNASESVEQINQYFWLLSQQGYFTKQSAR